MDKKTGSIIRDEAEFKVREILFYAAYTQDEKIKQIAELIANDKQEH